MTRDEQGALDAVRSYLHGYAEGDVDACLAVIAGSRPVLIFGTNADEVLKSRDDVRAALMRDRDSMANIRLGEFRHLQVEAAPEHAFVLLELPIAYEAEGGETETILRFALSLAREGERWVISSGMASVPFAAGTYSFTES